MPFKTIIEPFKIKTVEPIRWTTREERAQLLERAHYNLFLLPADTILIDLLTDSGTAPSSSIQNPKSQIQNPPDFPCSPFANALPLP
jgi:tryptophanase